MDEQQQIIDEFLLEAAEIVDRLDQDLVALEAQPESAEIINRIFRAIHTLKGTCGFLGFTKLESISHVGENLLDGLRAGRLVITQEITTALLQLVDATRTILQAIESSRQEGEREYRELKELLARLNSAPAKSTTVVPITLTEVVGVAAPPSSEPVPAAVETSLVDQLEQCFAAAQAEYAAQPTAGAVSEVRPEVVEPVGGTPMTTCTEEPAVESPKEIATPPEDEKRGGVADTSLRVDVALLDQLMNLVGELVLARNQILQFTKSQSDTDFIGTSQRLNLITSELQEQVMRTRMQPIANVWNKFPRVVRDVARLCNKQVRIEMEGKETDLDKTIIEAIKDPLTHIVRNSVDHGIEKPDVRVAQGKNPEGRLLLRAFHEGGHVIIEIADDGAGLNTERIRAKALERGLVSAENAQRMSEQEVNRLIFLPGFSTAEQVTNISGRGVGMDVVRSNIEKIGGTVDLSSVRGAGTTLRIKIPLTLAIVPALIVSAGGERFAVPQVSLVELVRVEGNASVRQIERIHGSPFFRLRGNLLPLVYLGHELELPPSDHEGAVLNIVVVKAEDRNCGLVVDRVHDTEEIVVKPLGKQLKKLSVFAGATIMGDGHVALILDVLGLARRARVVGEVAHATDEQRSVSSAEADVAAKTALLIVQAGKGCRAAVPLATVHRLEEFPVSAIEYASGMPVVQYRGGILPLVDLPLFLTGNESIGDEQKRVVVFSSAGREFGCVVDKIVDIVEDCVDLHKGAKKRGILGSAIIQKQVTDLLDLDAIVGAAQGEAFEPLQPGGGV